MTEVVSKDSVCFIDTIVWYFLLATILEIFTDSGESSWEGCLTFTSTDGFVGRLLANS